MYLEARIEEHPLYYKFAHVQLMGSVVGYLIDGQVDPHEYE